MKKSTLISITIIMAVIFIFAGCSDEKTTTNKKATKNTKTYTLQLDVELEENIFFSTYDVEIYVDDTKLGSVKQGGSFKDLTSLNEGEHEISFNKIGHRDVDGSTSISIDKDKAFSCSLKAHNDEIDIKNVQEESLEAYNKRVGNNNETESQESKEKNSSKSKVKKVKESEKKYEKLKNKLDSCAGKKLSTVIDKTRIKGYKTKYIATNTGDDLSYDIETISESMYVKSININYNKKIITVNITPKFIIEKKNSEKKLSERISASDAWVAAKYYGRSQYGKSFELHYFRSPLCEDPNEDGTAWLLKAPCTINDIEYTCEATVGGTGDDPNVIDFFVY